MTTQIVRFLLERAVFRVAFVTFRLIVSDMLRCGHRPALSLNAPGPIYPGLEGLAFVPPFIEGRGAFLSDQDLAVSTHEPSVGERVPGLAVHNARPLDPHSGWHDRRYV
jgi:hypothetical protein